MGSLRIIKGLLPLPMPPSKPSSAPPDRLVRLQIFLAFVVPLLLVIGWLSSRGFFSVP
jgi:hypothetical protein